MAAFLFMFNCVSSIGRRSGGALICFSPGHFFILQFFFLYPAWKFQLNHNETYILLGGIDFCLFLKDFILFRNKIYKKNVCIEMK